MSLQVQLKAIVVTAGAVIAVGALAACSSSATTSPSASPSASASSPAATSAKPTAASAQIAGSFIPLSTYEADKSKYANSNVVYFFNASWCPTCQEAVKNLDGSAGSFPENLTVVDVDYDNSSELRKQYGVTYQHTFVEVAPDGKMIKKWTGSVTPEEIQAEL